MLQKHWGAKKHHINLDVEEVQDFRNFGSTTIGVSIVKSKRLYSDYNQVDKALFKRFTAQRCKNVSIDEKNF